MFWKFLAKYNSKQNIYLFNISFWIGYICYILNYFLLTVQIRKLLQFLLLFRWKPIKSFYNFLFQERHDRVNFIDCCFVGQNSIHSHITAKEALISNRVRIECDAFTLHASPEHSYIWGSILQTFFWCPKRHLLYDWDTEIFSVPCRSVIFEGHPSPRVLTNLRKSAYLLTRSKQICKILPWRSLFFDFMISQFSKS